MTEKRCPSCSEYERVLEQREEQINDLSDRVDELEEQAKEVSAEFEGECWVALRRLLDKCGFEWSGEPVTADEAENHITEAIDDLEARIERLMKAH